MYATSQSWFFVQITESHHYDLEVSNSETPIDVIVHPICE